MSIVDRMKRAQCVPKTAPGPSKMKEQVNVRLSEEMRSALDQYIEQRERETGVPLSRALAVREILMRWVAAAGMARATLVYDDEGGSRRSLVVTIVAEAGPAADPVRYR